MMIEKGIVLNQCARVQVEVDSAIPIICKDSASTLIVGNHSSIVIELTVRPMQWSGMDFYVLTM